jgi:hypothetical protein
MVLSTRNHRDVSICLVVRRKAEMTVSRRIENNGSPGENDSVGSNIFKCISVGVGIVAADT